MSSIRATSTLTETSRQGRRGEKMLLYTCSLFHKCIFGTKFNINICSYLLPSPGMIPIFCEMPAMILGINWLTGLSSEPRLGIGKIRLQVPLALHFTLKDTVNYYCPTSDIFIHPEWGSWAGRCQPWMESKMFLGLGWRRYVDVSMQDILVLKIQLIIT